MNIKRFYQWSPQWRDKPETHEVLVELDKGEGQTEAFSIATCPSKAWALKVEQAMNALLKSDLKVESEDQWDRYAQRLIEKHSK